MARNKFTIGCDPEYFLRQRESGKLISAIPFINGTKYEPMPLPKGGNIQRDNVALEVATDPADSAVSFVEMVSNVLTEAVNVIPKDTDIVAIASASFDPDQLDHEEAQRFGCDPDYDAWTVAMNDPPCALDMTFRSAGAHIHVGHPKLVDNFDAMLALVRIMDCVHGVVSTILDNSKEAIDRRQLYGKPGSHRPKEYGVEYRVLSSYWTKSPVTVMMMYHLSDDALSILFDEGADVLVDEIGANRVQAVIRTGNVEEATRIFEENLAHRLSEDSIHYFNEALAKIKANDMDMVKEWALKRKEA